MLTPITVDPLKAGLSPVEADRSAILEALATRGLNTRTNTPRDTEAMRRVHEIWRASGQPIPPEKEPAPPRSPADEPET